MSRLDPVAAVLVAALGCVLALTACAATPAPAREAASAPPLPRLDLRQQRGHDVAARRCAGCHTIGLDDGGAGEGPAFYGLARRYDPITLERRFAQISAHGFDRMPPVELSRREAEDLIAYFDTLQGN